MGPWACAGCALAQGYPTKTVNIVVPIGLFAGPQMKTPSVMVVFDGSSEEVVAHSSIGKSHLVADHLAVPLLIAPLRRDHAQAMGVKNGGADMSWRSN